MLLVGSYLLFNNSAPSGTPVGGELFISNVTGYITGYPNETVELHLYWIKGGDGNFSGVFRVGGLLPCVKAGGMGLTELPQRGELRKALLSVTLTLGKPGRCVLDGAYVELLQGTAPRGCPLGGSSSSY